MKDGIMGMFVDDAIFVVTSPISPGRQTLSAGCYWRETPTAPWCRIHRFVYELKKRYGMVEGESLTRIDRGSPPARKDAPYV